MLLAASHGKNACILQLNYLLDGNIYFPAIRCDTKSQKAKQNTCTVQMHYNYITQCFSLDVMHKHPTLALISGPVSIYDNYYHGTPINL